MKILLTNDDGIGAPGLAEMYRVLKDLGEITVIAPTRSRSGAAHSITFHKPVACRKVDFDGQAAAYAVEGSPADCVKIAVMSILPHRPDLIISGLNNGSNAGINVVYSGTVAAAVEGAFLGIPAVAVSAKAAETNLPRAAKIARCIIDQIIASGLTSRQGEQTAVLNVNIPHLTNGAPRGIRIVPQSLKGFAEMMAHKGMTDDGACLYQLRGEVNLESDEAETDIRALEAGYVTITPLKFDLTHHDFLKHLAGWKPEL